MSIDDSCLGIFGKNHFTDKLKYNSLFISKIVLHNIISASYLETLFEDPTPEINNSLSKDATD